MDVVSTRCKLSQGCQAIGCRRVKNQCIDAAEWQCATRKKQLDCIVAQDLSPIDMQADLDQMCGATLLNQVPTTSKYCLGGARHGENCDKSKVDCPPLHQGSPRKPCV